MCPQPKGEIHEDALGCQGGIVYSINMHKGHRKAIFSVNYIITRSDDRRSRGDSGLGLFPVKRVLEKYGFKGSLEYQGGTFSVLISSQ